MAIKIRLIDDSKLQPSESVQNVACYELQNRGVDMQVSDGEVYRTMNRK